MDWNKLSEEEFNQFISLSSTHLPYSGREQLNLAQKIFSENSRKILNQDNTIFTPAVVDLYVSSLGKTKSLPLMTVGEIEILPSDDPLYQEVYLKPGEKKRLLRILEWAGRIGKEIDTITPKDLVPYNDQNFLLFKLICGQFRHPNDFFKIYQQESPCTPIGERISQSLIKVAATRIFADPYQSLLELPVNSLDAYATKLGLPTVGKFGLGFYSIFYWLIGHPTRSLEISNESDEGHWRLVVQEKQGQLQYRLTILNIGNYRPSLTIQLNSLQDPIPSELFLPHLNKLRETNIAKISLNDRQINIASPDNPLRVDIYVEDNGFSVHDNATGLKLSTLFGNLLVPTISNKTIKKSLQFAVQGGVNPETRIQPSDKNNFTILVGQVGVITIPFQTLLDERYLIVLSLSLNVRLPTSRDDVIIESLVREDLEANLDQLLLDSYTIRTLTPLQSALTQYRDRTSSKINKNFIDKYLSWINQKILNLEQIPVPEEFRWIYWQINPKRYIPSLTYSIEQLESDLIKNVDFNRDIYLGKYVTAISFKPLGEMPPTLRSLVPNSPSTSAGTSKILFVDYDYQESQPNWPTNLSLIEINDTLIPIYLDYGQAISQDIQTALSWVQSTFSQKTLDLLTNFLLRYRKLSTYFKMTFFEGVKDEEDAFRKVDLDVVSTCYTLWSIHDNEDWIANYLMEYFKILSKMVPETSYGSQQPKLHYQGSNLTYVYGGSQIVLTDRTPENFKRTVQKLIIDPIDTLQVRGFDQVRSKYKRYIYETLLWSLNQPVAKKMNILVQITIEYNPIYSSLVGLNEDMVESLKESRHFLEFLTLNTIRIIKRNLSRNLTMLYREELRKINPFSASSLYIIQSEYDLSKLERYLADYLFALTINDQGRFFEDIIDRLIEHQHLISSITPIQVDLPKDFSQRKVNMKLSSLIGLTFREPLSQDRFLDTIMSIPFEQVRPIEQLQIIEVAINENTVKNFWEAVMTELVQNSLDALRTANLPLEQRQISIKLGSFTSAEGGSNIIFSITDSVGIPPQGYVALMVPFVSTKNQINTPDRVNITAGEIGSGFFNVYRESSVVYIESTRDGYHTLITDIPIHDQRGRTIDLEKIIQLDSSSNQPNGTTITLIKPVESAELVMYQIGQIAHQARQLFSLIPLTEAQVSFNNYDLQIPTQELSRLPLNLSEGQQQILAIARVADQGRNFISMVLTRGIPFKPLSEYFAGSDLLIPSVLSEISSNLSIDLQAGFTPVTNRTSINFERNLEQIFSNWVREIVYEFLLQNYLKSYEGSINFYLPQSTSVYYRQLYFGRKIYKMRKVSDWLLYYVPSNSVNLASAINDTIDYLKRYDNPTMSSDKIIRQSIVNDLVQRYLLNKTYSPIQKQAIKKWFQVKYEPQGPKINKEINKPPINRFSQSSQASPVEETILDKIHNLTILTTIIVQTFWEIGLELETKGNLINTNFKDHPVAPSVIWQDEMLARGAYLPHQISLNASAFFFDSLDGISFLNQLNSINKSTLIDFTKIWLNFQSNQIFKSIFGLIYPSSVLIHELTHAWRNENHNQPNVHDSFLVGIGSRPPERLTFDQAANQVAIEIMSQGFVDKIWAKLTN